VSTDTHISEVGLTLFGKQPSRQQLVVFHMLCHAYFACKFLHCSTAGLRVKWSAEVYFCVANKCLLFYVGVKLGFSH
jgi:hypothetical protein